MIADHFVPAKDARSAELQARLKRWAEEQGVMFYGQGRGGIEHTLLCEDGWIVPGSVVAGGDSHTCTYGALGAFGTGLGSTDIACCLAFGEFWQVVPETIQMEFGGTHGPLRDGQGPDPRRARPDRRQRRHERVLEFVGDGRGGADHRRAARGRQHGGRGGLRDGHLPRRRHDGGVSRGPHRTRVDGGAHRSRTRRSRSA